MIINFETGEILELPGDDLISSNLRDLQLHRAIFDGLNVSGADFTGSHLRNASFNYSLSNRVVMRGVALMNATFIGAELKEADLTNVVAIGADFSEADLSMSDLQGADIGSACFEKTNLCGVNLAVKKIGEAVFFNATYDDKTIWPEGFNPESHGAIKV